MSNNTTQFIHAITKAADRLDPVLVNEFMNFGVESVQAHYEIIKPTLTEKQQLRHLRVINTGSILLYLLTSLRSPTGGEV